MTAPAQNYLTTAVTEFYRDWRMRMFNETEVLPPHWDNLDADQRAVWMLAFAATAEVGGRMAVAVGAVMGKSDGN